MIFADLQSILRPGDKLAFEVERRDASLVVKLISTIPNADLNEKDERKRKLTVLLARPFMVDLSLEQPDADFRQQYEAYASVYTLGRDRLSSFQEEMAAAVAASKTEPKKDSTKTANTTTKAAKPVVKSAAGGTKPSIAGSSEAATPSSDTSNHEADSDDGGADSTADVPHESASTSASSDAAAVTTDSLFGD